MAHGVRDKGMTRIYKVILPPMLPSAKLISSITATKFRTSTLLLMSLFNTNMWTKQAQRLSPEWSVLYELSCYTNVLTGMHVRHAGYLDNCHMSIDLSGLKTCSVIPGRLSEQAVSKYGTVASYFGIGKIKILRKRRWNIYKIGAKCPLHYYTLPSLRAVAFKLIGHSLLNGMLCTHAKGSRIVCSFLSQFRLREQYVMCRSGGMEE